MSSAGVGETFAASAPFAEEFFDALMESEPGYIGGQKFKKSNFEDLIDSCLGVGALQIISLGGFLLQIRDSYYVAEDQKFGQYCYERFGLGTQEALRLIGIFYWARSTNLSSSQIADLGLQKLLLLAEKVAPEAMPQMFDTACDATCPELRNKLKKCADQNEKKLKWTNRHFRLAPDQIDTIETALQVCKKEAGTKSDSVALTWICVQFLSDLGEAATHNKVVYYLESVGLKGTLELVSNIFEGIEFSSEIGTEED